ncbi:DUF1648 domain-containing protein [Streptomyces sp. NPDC057939]|uniref:DUF1648 domain-containing protein n=1 Tax=Streptomyces sp. NPDC057939 TaxID=3346284 RepID=UPI0036ED94D5
MDRTVGATGARTWGVGVWVAGIMVLLVALPLAAARRLPDRVATHWGGGDGGGPDGSMPLWAAALVPALVWALLVLGVLLARRLGGPSATEGWAAAALLSGGVFLAGGQAAVVRANLDREDWRQAGSVTGQVVAVVAVGAAAALVGVLARRRRRAGEGVVPGPVMEIPEGRRLVWFSRASNAWLQLTAALCGVLAVAGALAGLGGLVGAQWLTVVPFAVASVLVLTFSSVRARVGVQGLAVAFGPLGWPVRRWAAGDIESARVEERGPARAGGWGYRINGLGTTVMLRGGECLVIRAGGRDFAVSVDDAERGAALLNSLKAAGGRPGH